MNCRTRVRLETKFLRLQTPVTIGSRFGEWRVCWLGAPRWSPDSRRIAFSVLSGGNRDIYYVDADGGAPKQLTSEASEEGRPSWSQDGQWIYFYSNRSGTQQIWKRSLANEQMAQVTFGGGHEAFESPDGKFVLYTRPDVAGLWAVPVGNSAEQRSETKLLERVQQSTWAVGEHGIYFVDFEGDSRSGKLLMLYEFKSDPFRVRSGASHPA